MSKKEENIFDKGTPFEEGKAFLEANKNNDTFPMATSGYMRTEDTYTDLSGNIVPFNQGQYYFTPNVTGNSITWTNTNLPEESQSVYINRKAWDTIIKMNETYQDYIKMLRDKIEELEKQNKKLSAKQK